MKRIDIRKICSEVSEKHNVPMLDVLEMYTELFRKIKYYLQLPSMPRVAFSNLFFFRKEVLKIMKRMEIVRYYNNIGDVSSTYVERIENYFKSALENVKNRKTYERKFDKWRRKFYSTRSGSST